MTNNKLHFYVFLDYNVESVFEELAFQLKESNHSLDIEFSKSENLIILSQDEVFSKNLLDFVCTTLDGYAILLPIDSDI